MTREELDARHPQLLPALSSHPHVGWVLVQSREHGAVVLGAGGTRYLEEDRVDGDDPLAGFHATAAQHLLRTHGFAHAPDLLVGSFYDPGARRGLRLRGADLVPRRARRLPDAAVPALPGAAARRPDCRVVGAETLHRVLVGWRRLLESGRETPADRRRPRSPCAAMIASWRGTGQRSSSPATGGPTSPACTGSAGAACGSSARPSSS